MRKWNWQFKVSIKREASFLFSIFNTQSSIRPNTRPSPVPPANEHITHQLLNTTHTMNTSHTNYRTPPTQWDCWNTWAPNCKLPKLHTYPRWSQGRRRGSWWGLDNLCQIIQVNVSLVVSNTEHTCHKHDKSNRTHPSCLQSYSTIQYSSVRLGCSLLWALWAHPSVSQTQYKQ